MKHGFLLNVGENLSAQTFASFHKKLLIYQNKNCKQRNTLF